MINGSQVLTSIFPSQSEERVLPQRSTVRGGITSIRLKSARTSFNATALDRGKYSDSYIFYEFF